MPRLTKAQKDAIELQNQQRRSEQAAFERGLFKGAEAAKLSMEQEYKSAKLQQMQAAAKIAEEVGRMASRLGYMIGKINQDPSR